MSSNRQQQRAPAPSQTTTQPPPSETRTEPARILRLRGGHTSTGRSVQWAEDVIDNEGLGRKSSKGSFPYPTRRPEPAMLMPARPVCCIYHKPKPVDESSDESDSSDSSDSDSDAEPEGAKKAGGKKADCGHNHGRRRDSKPKKAEGKRAPSPNAYEKIPKSSLKDTSGGSKV
ncbi:hypothetical protein G7046_g7587 [Stylonectria norvegica]|nr:hypothetical protein G7046_g7587 [Stylonectria norvegica]